MTQGGRKSLRKRKTIDFALLATSGQESFEAWDDNVSLEDARRNVQLTSELEDTLNADVRPDELRRKRTRAVINAGLMSELSDLEQRHFTDLMPEEENERSIADYFKSRNHILRQWDASPTDFLTIETAQKGFDMDSLKRTSWFDRAYDFLYQYGFINNGILSHGDLAHPTFSPGARKRIIVIGAGASGLACARQLQGFGHSVVVLEARSRIGGRVKTRTASNGAAIDIGASLITGVTGNPITLLCRQLYGMSLQIGQPHSKLHAIQSKCPMFDSDGKDLSTEVDDRVFKVWNLVLEGVHFLRKRVLLEEASPSSGASSDQKKSSTVPNGITPKKMPPPHMANGVDSSAASLAQDSSMAPSAPASVSTSASGQKAQNGEKPSAIASDGKATEAEASGDAMVDDAEAKAAPEAEVPPQNGVGSDGKSSSTDAEATEVAASSKMEIVDEKAAAAGASSTAPGGVGGSESSSLPSPEELEKKLIDFLTEKQINTLSLLDGVEIVIKELGLNLTKDERKLFDWHMANLEYGCAQDLSHVSLLHWDQDDPYEFGGKHCMLREGYGPLIDALAQDIDIQTSCVVEKIEYSPDTHCEVFVKGADESMPADAVVCSVPLGVLKSGIIEFEPALPKWKDGAIRRLGAGNLNKVILEFPVMFWDASADIFGKVPYRDAHRGKVFLFWNLARVTGGKPVLVSLLAGQSSFDSEEVPTETLVRETMDELRRIYGPAIPSPVSTRCSRWAADRYARGSYAYIPVGSSGDDYDLLAKPVFDKIFFAGEATHRNHPATVAGAYLSGLRCAGEIEAIGKSFPPPGAIQAEKAKSAFTKFGKSEAAASADGEDGHWLSPVERTQATMPALHQYNPLPSASLSSHGSLGDSSDTEEDSERPTSLTGRKRPAPGAPSAAATDDEDGDGNSESAKRRRMDRIFGHPPPGDTTEDTVEGKEQSDERSTKKDTTTTSSSSDGAFTTSLGVLRQDVSFVSSAPLSSAPYMNGSLPSEAKDECAMVDDEMASSSPAPPTSSSPSKKRRLSQQAELPDFVTPTAVRVLSTAADFSKKRKFYERPAKLARDRRFIVDFNRRQRFRNRCASHVSIALGVKLHRDWLKEKQQSAVAKKTMPVTMNGIRKQKEEGAASIPPPPPKANGVAALPPPPPPPPSGGAGGAPSAAATSAAVVGSTSSASSSTSSSSTAAATSTSAAPSASAAPASSAATSSGASSGTSTSATTPASASAAATATSELSSAPSSASLKGDSQADASRSGAASSPSAAEGGATSSSEDKPAVAASSSISAASNSESKSTEPSKPQQPENAGSETMTDDNDTDMTSAMDTDASPENSSATKSQEASSSESQEDADADSATTTPAVAANSSSSSYEWKPLFVANPRVAASLSSLQVAPTLNETPNAFVGPVARISRMRMQ